MGITVAGCTCAEDRPPSATFNAPLMPSLSRRFLRLQRPVGQQQSEPHAVVMALHGPQTGQSRQ